MKLGPPATWKSFLHRLPPAAVHALASRLGVGPQPREALGAVIGRVVRILEDGTRIGEIVKRIDASGRLALRLALETDDNGMLGASLLYELERLGRPRAAETITDLVRLGLLLPDLDRPAPGERVAALYAGAEAGNWMLIAHPATRDELADTEVPGESAGWNRLAHPIAPPDPLYRAEPEDVLAMLRGVLAVIEAVPNPHTKQGDLRATARRRLDTLPALRDEPYLLGSWLTVLLNLRILRWDEGLAQYEPTPRAAELAADPLGVLADFVRPATALATYFSPLPRGLPNDLRVRRMSWPELRGKGLEIGEIVVAGLRSATASFLTPRTWFLDEELLPIASANAHKWVGAQPSWVWGGRRDELGEFRRACGEFLQLFFHDLALLGVVERARVEKAYASRLTPLGQTLLAGPDGRLPGRPAWSDDGRLVANDPSGQALFALALGTLATPVDPQDASAGFSIDEAGLDRALRSGIQLAALEARLERLVPGAPVPAPVRAALAAAAGRCRPVTITDDVIAVRTDAIGALAARQAGFHVEDTLVLAPRAALAALRQVLGQGQELHDYSQPPLDVVTLDPATRTLAVPPSERADWHLASVLEALGLALDERGQVRLGLESVPLEGLTDPQAVTAVRGLLGRLARHVQGGVPDRVRVCLLADVGLVAAPKVEEALVVAFPEEVARGIDALDILGELAEVLPGGRFLVPRGSLRAVEARLSELSIPFPADKSSLREKTAARAAVGALHDALQSLGPRTPAPAPPPAPPAAPRPAPARKTAAAPAAKHEGPPPAAESSGPTSDEDVYEVVEFASQYDGEGLALGAVAEALGVEREDVKSALRRLVAAGRLTLTGHARGARYRASGEP